MSISRYITHWNNSYRILRCRFSESNDFIPRPLDNMTSFSSTLTIFDIRNAGAGTDWSIIADINKQANSKVENDVQLTPLWTSLHQRLHRLISSPELHNHSSLLITSFPIVVYSPEFFDTRTNCWAFSVPSSSSSLQIINVLLSPVPADTIYSSAYK